MIDLLLLQYTLAKHGISRTDLIQAENWSTTTYTRKVVSGESDWTVAEINRLVQIGISWAEIDKIFFDRKTTEVTQEQKDIT